MLCLEYNHISKCISFKMYFFYVKIHLILIFSNILPVYEVLKIPIENQGTFSRFRRGVRLKFIHSNEYEIKINK